MSKVWTKVKAKNMNIYTKMISEIAGVGLTQALDIQNHIDENINLDWSEASWREIKKAIIQACDEMMR